jgi:O-antigen/teichoic acid export membrane protein
MSQAEADILDSAAAGGAAVRGGVLRVAGYVVGLALSVASTALLFRHLGVVDTGRYVTVISLIGIAQGLTDVGISALGVRELSVRDAEGQARLMRALVGLRLVLTTLGVLGAAAFAELAGYGGELVAGTLVAGVGLVVQNLQGTYAIALQSRLRLGWVTFIELVRQLVTVALIVALVTAGATLVPFLAIPIAAGAVTALITAALVRGLVPLRPSGELAVWLGLAREALAFVVATAVYTLYFRVAVIVVSLIATEEVLGYFGASFRIVEVLILIPSIAVGAAFPIFARSARDDPGRLAYGVQRTFEVATIFGAWMGLALALAAPFAIGVVAGSNFGEAIPMLRLQSVALASAFVTQAFGYALLSMRHHRPLLVFSAAMLIVTAGLTVVLTHAYGGEGAAIAVSVGELVYAVGLGVSYSRASPRGGPALGVLTRVAVAAGASVGVALVVGGPSFLQAVVASLVYFGLLLALRAIPQELLRELRR